MPDSTRANSDVRNVRQGGGFLRVLGVAFDVALSALESRIALDASAAARCRSLREALFARALTRDSGAGPAAASREWEQDVLVSDASLRAGVLTVYGGKPVPIHDHPGSAGLLLVVDGILGVREFCRADTSGQGATATALRMLGERRFAPAQHTLITPEAGNLHSLAAHSEVCVALDILFTPCAEFRRTWYMPLDWRYGDTSPFPAMSFNPAHCRRRPTGAGTSRLPGKSPVTG